jgi:hypothetical protein
MRDETLVVKYRAGYQTIPPAIGAVVFDMTRRQLEVMGVSVNAGAAASAPVRAVSIGQLRVEYAVSLVGDAARGAQSPVLGAVLEQFKDILSLHRHPRMLAGMSA